MKETWLHLAFANPAREGERRLEGGTAYLETGPFILLENPFRSFKDNVEVIGT